VIPSLAVCAVVAPVIQLDPQDGPHSLGFAQQEIDMLAINPVGEGTVFSVVTGRDEEQIPEIHFWAYHCPVAHNAPQDLVKADLRIGKKVVPELKGQLRCATRRLVLRREPIQYALDNIIDRLTGKADRF
jgi:hypothetical protein